jgi:hypothetical protein
MGDLLITARKQAEASMLPDDELLTTAEVGGILRRPQGTIRQWRHRNYGPRGFRIGGSVLYRRSAVDAWIRRCEAADQPGESAA